MQWSPDGKRLLIRGRLGKREPGLYVTDVETNTTHRLTDRKRWPQWSRDGQWIYYSDSAQDNSQIWKIPAEGGEPIQVTKKGGIFFAQEADDGFLYYTKRRQPSSEKWDDIWRIPIGGGEERPFLENLFLEGKNCTMWRNHLVYRHWVNEEGVPDIAPGRRSVMDMMNLETGEVTRLHTFDPEDRFCFGTAVSPDGQSILYAPVTSSGGSDLVLVENFQ
jgi:dipeptidyl aminopeptidase/acylaminoacyl peptidase